MTDVKEQKCTTNTIIRPIICPTHQFSRYVPEDLNHYEVKTRSPNSDIDELSRLVAKECVAGPGHEVYIYVKACQCGENEYPAGLFTVMRINGNGQDRNTYGLKCGCVISLDNMEWFLTSEESARGVVRVV